MKKGTRVLPPTGTMALMASERERNSYVRQSEQTNSKERIDLLSKKRRRFTTRFFELLDGDFDVVFVVDEVGNVHRHLVDAFQTQLAFRFLNGFHESNVFLRMLVERNGMVL